MTHSRKNFDSAADATAAQQQSLVSRGQRAADQPAGNVPRTDSRQAGQQLGNFKSFSAAAGADETEGPLSQGQRPGTTGSRGGCHSGSIGRDAGGCFAADHVVLRPVGLPQGNFELSRPGASEDETDSSRLQVIRGEQAMESGGVGEIAFSPGGLIQGPT